MSMYAELEKPPFFTAIYMAPEEGQDHGLFTEAASTLVSTAMLLSGFIGFSDDQAARDRPVKIVYWRTYHAMTAWHRVARDLLPHRVEISDCIAAQGCHWRWFEQVTTAGGARPRKAA